MDSEIAKLIFELELKRREFQGELAAVEGDVQSSGNRITGRLGGLVGTLGKAVAGVALAAGAAGVAMGGMGLAGAAANEQAAIGFETLLGSAEAAQGFMGNLADFAAKTPFELPGLRDAASRFLAVGVEADRVIPIMTVLGDATSAVGTGSEGIDRAVTALGQMQQKGKVTGEEMLQLVEAGVPAWDALAAKLGVDVPQAQEMVSKNQVQVNDLFSALEERAGPALQRVTGMMDKQSASLTGMISTLKDTVQQGLAGAMGPAVDALKGALPGITETITGVMSSVGPALGQMFEGLGPLISPLVGVLGSLLQAILPIIGMVAGGLAPVFAELVDLLGEMQPEIQSLVGTFGSIVRAVAPLLVPLVALISPLAQIAQMLGGVLYAAAQAIVPVIVQVAGIFQGALQQTITALQPVLYQLATSLMELLMALMPLIPVLAQLIVASLPLLPAILQLLPPIVDLATLLVGMLVPVLTVVAETITAVVVPVVNFLAGVLSNPMAPLQALGAFFSEIWAGIRGAVSGAVDWVSTKIDEMVGFVRSIPGRILDAIGDLSGLLLDAGKAVIRGFINGIKSMIDGVKDTLGGIASKLTSWKGPPEKDRVLLFGAGQLVMGGFIRGIEASVPELRRTLSQATDVVATAAGDASLAAAGPGRGGGAAAGGPVQLYVHVEVHGSVTAEQDLALSVRDELLRVRGRYPELFPPAAAA